MKVLLADKVAKYINNLSADKYSIFLKQLNVLKNKSKENIKRLREVIELSKNESIEFFGYYIVDSTYAVFAFNKKNLIIVDLIELKDNKVNSVVLKSEEKVGE